MATKKPGAPVPKRAAADEPATTLRAMGQAESAVREDVVVPEPVTGAPVTAAPVAPPPADEPAPAAPGVPPVEAEPVSADPAADVPPVPAADVPATDDVPAGAAAAQPPSAGAPDEPVPAPDVTPDFVPASADNEPAPSLPAPEVLDAPVPAPADPPDAGRAPGEHAHHAEVATRAEKAPTEYLLLGGDFDEVVAAQRAKGDETVVINMGPQHPSTHGVLRLEVELDGEQVTSVRPGIGFLHTGIEKSLEYRTWSQGSAFVTRMDYIMPMFNEATYCLAVEKLAGIEVPERASILRVLVMELNRIASHLVAIGTGGMEIGALTVMTVGFREREMILDFFESLCGTRMNHAYIRPGGVSIDLPDNGLARLRTVIEWLHKHLPEYAGFCNANPIFKARMSGIATMTLAQAMSQGVTGPPLRATGYPWDLRKKQPYCGYEDYDFDVITWDTCDAYGRFRVRLSEMWESLKIVEQCYDKLEKTAGQPHMTTDPKVAMPGTLSLGPDGQGQSLTHVKHIMGESMEGLIHHFKMVTEGFRVPAGQAYQAIESPKGELACHVVSDGGTRPYRVHFRDPGFHHLQSVPLLTEGGMMSDIVVALASLDPVLGGVDR